MKKIILFLLLTILIFVVSCAKQIETPSDEKTEEAKPMQVANPASVYCIGQGGRLEIRTNADGSQTGYCIAPDGTECEEWSYYRKECSKKAEQNGEAAKKEAVLQPPTGPVSVYKGFWMPTAVYYPYDGQTMTDVESVKESGANIVSFGPTVKINSGGGVMYSQPFASLEDVDGQLSKLIEKYYGAGIRVQLAIEVFYEQEFTARGGEPQPIPRPAAEQEGFLDNFNLVVEDMAKLAEKYKVEMFSPMNEPDRKLGAKTASEWGQKILPAIKKHYSGKVVFKGDLSAGAGKDIDFSGYDAIGFSITPRGGPISGYRKEASDLISSALGWASRDSVPEVIATEFGVWGGASGFDDATKAEAYRIVFEEGKGKLKGFIAFDPPQDQGWSLKQSQKVLEEIKAGFKD